MFNIEFKDLNGLKGAIKQLETRKDVLMEKVTKEAAHLTRIDIVDRINAAHLVDTGVYRKSWQVDRENTAHYMVSTNCEYAHWLEWGHKIKDRFGNFHGYYWGNYIATQSVEFIEGNMLGLVLLNMEELKILR